MSDIVSHCVRAAQTPLHKSYLSCDLALSGLRTVGDASPNVIAIIIKPLR
jgi:hypothetical protein